MAEELISNLGYETPQSDTNFKNSLNAFSPEIANCIWARFTQKNSLPNLTKKKWKLFNNYKAKLSGQMVKSLGKSIINMYSMGACSVLGITNQDELSEDLENDPFLNSALQRFTCELYHRFGSFIAPLSFGIITSRHYLSEHNKNGEQQVKQETIKMEETRKQPSKSEVIGSFIGMGMVGFCFGIGLMLAVKTVNNVECCINRKCL